MPVPIEAAGRLVDDYRPAGYSSSYSEPTEALPYALMTFRTGRTGDWNNYDYTPGVISRYTILGSDGADGEDGHGTEFIYRLQATATAPSTPANNASTDNYIPSGWSNTPSSISSTNPYLFISTRQGTTGNWNGFSTPRLWAQWVSPGGMGAQGDPGPGIQMRFRVTNSATAPSTPTNDADNDDYVPTGWSLTPPSVSSSNRYLYVTTRTGETGSWDDFSAPSLLSRFAPAGAAGSAGPKGDTGDAGADGDGIQYVFRLTSSNTAPSTPSNDADNDDYVPTGWSSGLLSVSATNQYLWASTRTGTTENWDDFSAPALIARYAADGAAGSAGPKGDAGDAGADGDGIQYVFRLTSSNTAPSTPSNDADNDDYVPTGWSSGLLSVSATNQ